MEKQKRQLIVLLLLLLAVVVAYIGLRLYNRRQTEWEEDGEKWQVTQDQAENITEFAFTNENGSFHFKKKNEAWYCKENEEISIDQTVLEDMIEKAVTVESSNKVENVQDMAQYGLEQPELTVSYTLESGENKSLKIGDYNQTIYLYYLCLDGETNVYTIDSAWRTSFMKDLEDIKTVETQEDETAY